MTETILLIILSLGIFGYAIYRSVNTYFMDPFYYRKLDWFNKYPVEEGDIVFLGDSLTDWGLWNEMFPGLPIKNRGIGGERIKGLYQRLDNVISGKPSKIFLMIGTNDLPHVMFHDDCYILNYYRLILSKIKSTSPGTEVFIESILPRQKLFAKRIVKLNAELKALAALEGLVYLDIYPLIADDDGVIRRDLSNDELHLMAEGYRLWSGVVRPHLINDQELS